MKDEKRAASVRFILHPSFFILEKGGLLSVALSLPFDAWRRLRAVAVSHHRVLWSPDFPLPEIGQRPSGRPADFCIIRQRMGLKASRSLRIIRKRRRGAASSRRRRERPGSENGYEFST